MCSELWSSSNVMDMTKYTLSVFLVSDQNITYKELNLPTLPVIKHRTCVLQLNLIKLGFKFTGSYML